MKNIAVVGSYKLPSYRNFVQTISTLVPEAAIVDLSRHAGQWHEMSDKRTIDISSADVVAVQKGWRDDFDARHDLHVAMQMHKTILMEELHEISNLKTEDGK